MNNKNKSKFTQRRAVGNTLPIEEKRSFEVNKPNSFGPIVSPDEAIAIKEFMDKNKIKSLFDLSQFSLDKPIVDDEEEQLIKEFYLKEQNKNAWIQTFSGRKFFPLNPYIDAIVIQDIAHALSMLCRFSGHCKQFYCVTPETQILTSRLIWKRAGDLHLNEGLLAFDEYPIKTNSSKNRNRRKLRYSKVLHNGIIQRPVYKLFLSDGSTIESSEDHPWLISTKKSRNQVWKKTKDLFEDLNNGKKRYMLKFIEPWNTKENSYEKGYLEGILDGESYVSLKRKGTIVGISQNPGPVLEKIKNLLIKDNIDFSELSTGSHKTKTCQVKGSWYEKLKLLGTYQPIRLINNFENFIKQEEWSKEFDSIDLLEILKIEFMGIKDVVALETSSHTYFANGFGAHNSVAQHSVLVSYLCDTADQFHGLLHDASEAYLVDIPTPIKRTPEFAFYKKAEHHLQSMIYKRFGLSEEEPTSVKRSDTLMLATEAINLLPNLHSEWKLPCQPLPVSISSLSPAEAEKLFLDRFNELSR
jgi:hypothetical protein